MSAEDNKALIQRFVDEVWNTGNVAVISDFFVEGSMLAGGIAGQIQRVRTIMPDLHATIDDMIAEGDKVVVRFTQRSTNTGPIVGLPAFGKFEKPLPPTGNTVTLTAIEIFTIADGKIVSVAREMDQLSLLQQLGWTFSPPNTNAPSDR